jgi:hypothetical protein
MTKINKGSFTSESLTCPICDVSLIPPVAKYCEHIAFYCVHGPVDDLIVEYHVDGVDLDIDSISTNKNWLEVGSEYNLSIYKFTEQDAYYPTTIILGINTQ